MSTHCCTTKDEVSSSEGKTIILVGNPNVGKSVIFSLLTGTYVTVSNYPGTTVEISRKDGTIKGEVYSVIDTPGINNLIPMSEDEQVTRDILLKEQTSTVIQVIDAKNLKRGLFLSLQLAEMGLSFIVSLNLMDEAKSRGISIDEKRLKELIGVEIIKTVAVQKKGIDKLRDSIKRTSHSPVSIEYPKEIEDAVKSIEQIIPETFISKRSVALMLLSGDITLKNWLFKNLSSDKVEYIEKIRNLLEKVLFQPINNVINQTRLQAAEKLEKQVLIKDIGVLKGGFLSKIGTLATHPFYGIFVLLGVLFLTYEFVGNFGAQFLVDLLQNGLFKEKLNPFAIKFFETYMPFKWLSDMFVGEYGIITMALTYSLAIIFPVVGTFFIAFGILEDSGYLPRLAVMVNKIFAFMGLNGKAVLPMVLGLGCDTMATLTARILETKKERIIATLLLALGIPCSAQLGVILGMLGGISFYATLLWSLIIIAVIFITGYLASKLLKGQASDFLIELPPIRIPQLSNIFIKTVARIEWYIKEAVPLFILGTFLLYLGDKAGLLQILEKIASPVVVDLLGLPAKTAEAFIIGFLRRDYGAAGLFDMQKQGLLTANQVLVSLVTITLFVPCIANFFIIIKERGMKTAVYMSCFIFPFAVFIGACINFALKAFGVTL